MGGCTHTHTHTHHFFFRKSSTQHSLDQRQEDRAQRFGWVNMVICRQGHDSLWNVMRRKHLVSFITFPSCRVWVPSTPQWGAVDAEIKVPSGENTELKRSPFKLKAWSRTVYSHTCYAYCQGFLPRKCLPFRSIHLHFSPKPLSVFFLCWLCLAPIPV